MLKPSKHGYFISLKTDIPTALDWRSYPNIEAVHPTLSIYYRYFLRWGQVSECLPA